MTYVADGQTCASACALAWLGGRVRAMDSKARIGFHAASFVSDGQVSSSGNALVGAYLSDLRLSSQAIVYITAAPPDDIRWMTFDDAQKNGIEVKRIDMNTASNAPLTPLAPQPSLPVTPTVAPSPPMSQTREVLAKHFVLTYFARTSAETQPIAPYLFEVYANTVAYYSKALPKGEVINDKLAFFSRWPVHRYSVDESSLKIYCGGDQCLVEGNVSWFAYSAKRQSRSTGTSFVEFDIRWTDGQPAIFSEKSRVLNRDIQRVSDAPPPQVAPEVDQYPTALLNTLLPPYCHMDACAWLNLEARESILKNPVGELFKVSTKRWSSRHPNGSYNIQTRRFGGEMYESYVFCSRTRPGVAFWFENSVGCARAGTRTF